MAATALTTSIELTEDDLEVLRDGIADFLVYAAGMRDALGDSGDMWQERIDTAVRLDERLISKQTELIIAQGGDPT